MMAYKNKADRDAKHEWQMEKKRPGAHEARMERQRARRAIDKKYYDDPKDKDKTAEIREGKDVAHVKAIDKGGSNKQGVRIEAPSVNRSFKRDAKRNLVSEYSTKERSKAKKKR
jgi:hypothetical protein